MKYNLIFYGIGFIILIFTNSWVNVQSSKDSDYELATFKRCLQIEKQNIFGNSPKTCPKMINPWWKTELFGVPPWKFPKNEKCHVPYQIFLSDILGQNILRQTGKKKRWSQIFCPRL